MHLGHHARPVSLSSAALLAALLASPAFGQQRTYDMNFTTSAPTIDGVFSAGEWDGVSGIESGWTLLRQDNGVADTANFAWQGMWDAHGMYFAVTSDKNVWSTPNDTEGGLNNGRDNINFYFDPNLDGEANVVPDDELDGYQIAFNTNIGNDRYEEGGGTRQQMEAHINGLFGDQGLWGGTNSFFLDGPTNLTMEYNTGASGMVLELFVPWLDLNAEGNTATAEGLTVTGPAVNDTWFFNIGSVNNTTPGNFLPTWNNSGANFFSSRNDGATAEYSGNLGGHGEITFVGALDGDINLDGFVGAGDLDILLANWGDVVGASALTSGDLSGDGVVGQADLDIVQANWGNGALPGSTIPEPGSLALITLGGLTLIRRRRR